MTPGTNDRDDAAPQPSRLDRVMSYIHGDGRAAPTLDEFLGGLVAKLRAEGVPVARAAAGAITLHPQFAAMRSVWSEEAGIIRGVQTHAERAGVAMGSTPLGQLIVGAPVLRTRLTNEGGTLGFRDFEELRAKGFTDWLGLQLRFDGRPVGGLTFSTRVAGGFDDAQVALLQAMHATAAVVIELFMQRAVMATVLRTYLGADVGERVQRGQIRRGDVQTIRAAIWFSDLRDFTGLSSRLPPEELVATLNACFGPMVKAVQAHGGQVLKFMGDGMLAIFPESDPSSGRACSEALAAAREARAALDEGNRIRAESSQFPLEFGLALHFGDAMYGNVGGDDRLDFTVIGPAVNTASRIEGQCKALGRWLLVSGEFAARCDVPFVALGPQSLKGIVASVPLFGLPA